MIAKWHHFSVNVWKQRGKTTHGKVNVCQIRFSHVPWLYNAAPTGNTGFMNFARKPFLLTSSKWGVKPLSK